MLAYLRKIRAEINSDRPYIIGALLFVVLLVIEASDSIFPGLMALLVIAGAGYFIRGAYRGISARISRWHKEVLAAEAERQRRIRLLEISGIDSLSGVEFERYIKTVMESQGYQIELTKASGDQGVDLIGRMPGRIVAIQCKRQGRPLSRRAVSDAVAGMAYYGCSEAMVITNCYFTRGAIELAEANRCTLVDRDQLTSWIDEFRKTTNEA